MNRVADRPIRKTGRLVLPVLLLAAAAIFLSGCAAPEGGSSIPWAEPEPWESQPSFGVPY